MYTNMKIWFLRTIGIHLGCHCYLTNNWLIHVIQDIVILFVQKSTGSVVCEWIYRTTLVFIHGTVMVLYIYIYGFVIVPCRVSVSSTCAVSATVLTFFESS